ncbi:MAG: FAD-binding domain-containing protein, partial [Saprospiraceae bacterium]|nr:FAD-binding domain-containing protein [Saprospiraceae bacterium]
EEEIFEIAHQAKTSWVFCNRERTGEETAVQDALERNLWSIGQEMRYSRGKMLLYTADLPFPVTHTPDHFTTFRKETERIVRIREPIQAPLELAPFSAHLDAGDMPSHDDFCEDDTGFIRAMGSGGEATGIARLNRLSDPSVSPEDRCISPWLSQGCLSPKRVYYHLQHTPDIPFQRAARIHSGLLYRDHLRLMVKKYDQSIFEASGTVGAPAAGQEAPSEVFWLWAHGKTGLPIIDAAMHQLVQTGFMPCKARQLCAQFLINELGVPWRLGASYFESYLVDYDPCSNWVNWGNIAGVGPDAREERPVNYVLQAKRLDPDGEYVKRWIPALRNADHQWIHQPDQADANQLLASEITLGRDYPRA